MGLVGFSTWPTWKILLLSQEGPEERQQKALIGSGRQGPHSCCLQEECQWDQLSLCEPQPAHSCLLVSLCPSLKLTEPHLYLEG